ncbi:hypothetical protein BLOT_002675 [Blomia tropicalis]|nr:hypothetical protein BLOT_002675 [Blomia tropicalis]
MLSTLSQTNFDLNVVECKNTSMNGGIGQYDFIVPTPSSTTTVAAAAAAAAAITDVARYRKRNFDTRR